MDRRQQRQSRQYFRGGERKNGEVAHECEKLLYGHHILQIKYCLKYIYTGDALRTLRTLPSESVDCVVTSPPYYCLRDYGVDGQIGLENSPERYIANLAKVLMECRRVLKNDGTMWIVIGDSYAGSGRG